ncbi:lipopolysaccharide-induced tumor necrosis factor-alpha factor homolog [Neocloeon triangulifer]|uniref:lipopolysaccharide-induced tumor necrosis factor-alpha factor homolog n=1 Tax=Neocloeon triangulifer TaxID=2078957 RepID=UPI00286F1626|nr:lipopolysaccharide-induced tumor necrosis factor-alpha factor homolog [Neocloeon triangulifer]
MYSGKEDISDHFYSGVRPPPYQPLDEDAARPHIAQDQMHPAPPPAQQPIGLNHLLNPDEDPNEVAVTQQPRMMVMQNRDTIQHLLVRDLKGLPHHSTSVTCSNCGMVVPTRVNHKAICKTHCWACCLFLFFCWPCICIPYCTAGCRKTNHYCTRCDSYLGNSNM